ncbi:MAG TPA: ATP-binding protein [Polyangiaceae bacterium]|nr:ATP-binding protein [Polyangiaceae bacterium]
MLFSASGASADKSNAGPVSSAVALVKGVVDGRRVIVTRSVDEPDGGSPDAGALSPEANDLVRSARNVRALVQGRLDVGVDPASLFDVAPDDDAAIRVEAVRLHAVVAAADDVARRKRLAVHPRKKSVPVEEPADGGELPASPVLLAARVELDRARLAFYDLPESRRTAILAEHAARQRVAASATPSLTAAEKRAQEADAERKRALEAATTARTEAERLVLQEHAKVLKVSQEQAEFETKLADEQATLRTRSEKTLGFERKVRSLVDGDESSSVPADDLYAALRAWLRKSRDDLDQALSESWTDLHAVPVPGADALSNLPAEVDRTAYDKARHDAEETAARLSKTSGDFGEERLKQLGEEVGLLNRDRLELLPFLSSAKRARVTGVGFEGIDQATAEFRQVSLIIRYHLHLARRWMTLLVQGRSARGAPMMAGLLAVKFVFAAMMFAWWRRRAEPLLVASRDRAMDRDRRARAVEPSRSIALLGFAIRIRRPLEWLAFGWVLLALMPDGAAELVEVHLARSAFTWTFGGALAVATIDALAASAVSTTSGADGHISGLRLRSLRLVGRTIVVFGLILSMSAQLVGRGTVHSWVSSTCWFAAIPVGLVVIRWWRDEIFQRIQRARKKGPFDLWIERNRTGWASFFAATAGGAYLFGSGTARAVRTWVSRFDVTRRALAYLFRRGLDRLAEESDAVVLARLPEAKFDALGPEILSVELVTTRSTAEIGSIAARIDGGHAGVFALVGERGSGKTTTLRQLQDAGGNVVTIDCPLGDLTALETALTTGLGLAKTITLDEAATRLDAEGGPSALLVDNAHRLIRPVMGGLAAFDRLVAAARTRSSRCTWVFAMDEVVWRFFERARGSRPLFDEVVVLEAWREEEIAELIERRSRHAMISPSYRLVAQRLPVEADEFDVEEALRRTAQSYHRLLWDYSAGNPGVALHLWRKSLGVDQGGETCVKPFQAPDTTDLEQLPDPAVFVLRAVIQLEAPTIVDIAEATMLPPGPVADTLRYGTSRGYLEKTNSRYRVTWTWFRALTRFLHRRHLLARKAD